VKNWNSSRLPWEEATAPKGAAAHSLGTTGLGCFLLLSRYFLNCESLNDNIRSIP